MALDTTLDDDLRLEGLAREVARRLNDLRKDIGLEIADRVLVELRADGDLLKAVDRHREWIAKEILAKDLDRGAHRTGRRVHRARRRRPRRPGTARTGLTPGLAVR